MEDKDKYNLLNFFALLYKIDKREKVTERIAQAKKKKITLIWRKDNNGNK